MTDAAPLSRREAADAGSMWYQGAAWMCTVVFLDLNGVDFSDVDQVEAYELVIDVASGKAENLSLIAEGLRSLRPDLA
ncbi:hypothetical protein [Streptomyces mayteni]